MFMEEGFNRRPLTRVYIWYSPRTTHHQQSHSERCRDEISKMCFTSEDSKASRSPDQGCRYLPEQLITLYRVPTMRWPGDGNWNKSYQRLVSNLCGLGELILHLRHFRFTPWGIGTIGLKSVREMCPLHIRYLGIYVKVG